MLQLLNMAQTPGGFLLILGLILGLLLWVFSQLKYIRKGIKCFTGETNCKLEELYTQLTNHIPHQIADLKKDNEEYRALLEHLKDVPKQIAELKEYIHSRKKNE